MNITVTVEPNRCENHGQCVFVAPEVFSFDDDHLVHDATPDPALYDKVHRAAAACPAGAIRIERTP